MAAFDSDWWDARCLLSGKVDTHGVPFQGDHHVTWIRWRLTDELLQRHFTDIGLEPAFGLMGTELYNVALHSPICRRAPRYFGRPCGSGARSASLRRRCPLSVREGPGFEREHKA